MYWSNGSGYGSAMRGNLYSGQVNQTTDIYVTGDTISCTFPAVGMDYNTVDLWGYVVEYVSQGNTFAEWWGEQNAGVGSTPGSGASTSGDNTIGGSIGPVVGNSGQDVSPPKTPGFEMSILIAASLSFILLRRRYYH